MKNLKVIDFAMIALIIIVLLFAALAIYCQTDELPHRMHNGYAF